MKKQFTLLKILAMTFLISEIFIGIGLVGLLALIPYSESMVGSQRGSLGLFVINGSPDWSLVTLLPNSREGTLSYNPQSVSVLPLGKFEYGNLTFGNFRFHASDGPIRLVTARDTTDAVVIDNLQGAVTFKHPANAAGILDTVKWPFVASMLCSGGITIAILDLIRRMFHRVGRGEAFTTDNIRNVHRIGFLLIASWLLQLLTTGWLKYRMVAVVMHYVAKGTISLDSSTAGDWSRLTMGLVILALAEVFRQGLVLKEENTLTI